MPTPPDITAFLQRWSASGAAERANAQSFITELCGVLGVEPPQPKTPDEAANAYVFEKTIPAPGGSSNFIDCYKRGCFVLEAKQGADADFAGLGGAAGTASHSSPTGAGRTGITRISPTRRPTASHWPIWCSRACACACARYGPTRSDSTRASAAPRPPGRPTGALAGRSA